MEGAEPEAGTGAVTCEVMAVVCMIGGLIEEGVWFCG